MSRDRSELGRAIKDRLKELGMTQLDLSEKASMHRQTISSSILGRRHVTDAERELFSKILDMSLEGLSQPKLHNAHHRLPCCKLGNIIREELSRRNMTQAGLALRVGITEGALSKVIHGDMRLSQLYHARITAFLGIDLPTPEENIESTRIHINIARDLQLRVETLEHQMKRVTDLITKLGYRREDV